ncbi:MAG: dCTP deaminase [Planctomycetota bacterium]
MILSNERIHDALDKKWLVIDPEPAPRRPTADHPSCPYQTSAVDLRLGTEIAYFKEGLAVSIDLRRGKFAELFGPNSESRVITDEQPYALYPGKFVIGKTLERVELPAGDSNRPSLAARVEGRSSYARCGMLVHFTAPTIHSGYKGTITLEIINLGPIPILLYPHAPICQLIVEQVDGTPFPNESQFQNQSRPSGSRSSR